MHQTVLLREAIDALVTRPAGFYVDGTFGRGGHSRHLLQCLDADGRVLGVDKDPEAQADANELASAEPRFQFFHGSFAELPAQLASMGVDAVDGILLDLGVSSPQLDDLGIGHAGILRQGVFALLPSLVKHALDGRQERRSLKRLGVSVVVVEPRRTRTTVVPRRWGLGRRSLPRDVVPSH